MVNMQGGLKDLILFEFPYTPLCNKNTAESGVIQIIAMSTTLTLNCECSILDDFFLLNTHRCYEPLVLLGKEILAQLTPRPLNLRGASDKLFDNIDTDIQ